MALSYFQAKRDLKHQIKQLDDQQAHYEALKVKTIARNKHAHDLIINPKYQVPITSSLYQDAQEIITTATQMMNEAAELITVLDESIQEIISIRQYFVNKLSVLII